MSTDRWSEADQSEEPMGTKEKRWLERPDGERWLFKLARTHGGDPLGEDWCECLVHGLATLLGVPTACVAPAIEGGERGVLSRSFVGRGDRLQHGNELLGRSQSNYDPSVTRVNPGYTPGAVREALQPVDPPEDLALFSAFDVWASYLLLDAWVAGRDRHHENWGVLTNSSGSRLAPSFDHGSALGFQEPEERLESIRDGGMEVWCRRGKSHHFAGKPQLTDLAAQALSLASLEAKSYWVGRLRDVRPSDVEDLLVAVPREIVSEQRCRFIGQMLDVNRKRLLDAVGA